MSRRTMVLAGAALALAGAARAQTPPRPSTGGWTVYRNPTLGFEVRYPEDWHVGRVTQTSGTTVSVVLREPLRAGRPTHRIQFWVQRGVNPHGLSLGDWFAEQMRAMYPGSPPPTSKLAIGGRAAMRMEHAGASGRDFVFYTALGKTDILTVTVGEPLAEHEVEGVYQRIIDSVRILEATRNPARPRSGAMVRGRLP